jgi:hypothetical protein
MAALPLHDEERQNSYNGNIEVHRSLMDAVWRDKPELKEVEWVSFFDQTACPDSQRVRSASGGFNASSDRLLLSQRDLRVRVVGVGLVGFMMADHTARRSAELAVASHSAGNAADDSALDAPLCLSRREGGECQQANRCENHFHGRSPRSKWSDGSTPWMRASSVRTDFAALNLERTVLSSLGGWSAGLVVDYGGTQYPDRGC